MEEDGARRKKLRERIARLRKRIARGDPREEEYQRQLEEDLFEYYELSYELLINRYKKKEKPEEPARERKDWEKEFGDIEVAVSRTRLKVRICGLYSRHIKPHLNDIQSLLDNKKILWIHTDLDEIDKTGKYNKMLTFSDDDSINEYLRVNGWQHIPDTF